MLEADLKNRPPGWSQTRFGTLIVPNTLETSTLPKGQLRVHEAMRILKNAFVGYPENVDYASLRDLQQRVAVSVVADVLRAGGVGIPMSDVPRCEYLIPDLVDLDLETYPLMLAGRPPLEDKNLAFSGQDSAITERHLRKALHPD